MKYYGIWLADMNKWAATTDGAIYVAPLKSIVEAARIQFFPDFPSAEVKEFAPDEDVGSPPLPKVPSPSG